MAATILLLGMLVLQLPVSKNALKNELTATFNTQFRGQLKINEIQGFLPFNAEATEGEIFSPSDSLNPAITFSKASVTFSWWELLQQNISIQTLDVEKPIIHLALVEGRFNISELFESSETARDFVISGTGTPQIFNRYNIYAPSLTITNGSARIDSSIPLPNRLQLPSPLTIENLNTTIFLEATEQQLFADIVNFRADLPDSEFEYFQLSGQFFNDDRFFELNGFELNSAAGQLHFGIEATPVNLFETDLKDQFLKAGYQTNIRSARVEPVLIKTLFPGWPAFDSPLEFQLTLEGNADELFIDRFQSTLGESSILLSGKIEDLLLENFSYQTQFENVVLHPDQKNWISVHYLDSLDISRYDISTVQGELEGNRNQTAGELEINTDAGSLQLDAFIRHSRTISYELLAEADSIDITPFVSDTAYTTILDGRIALAGSGVGADSELEASFDLSSSTVAGYALSKLVAQLSYRNREFHYSFNAEDTPGLVQTEGTFSNHNGYYTFTTDGTIQDLNLPKYFPGFHADSTRLNSTFSANLEGSGFDDLFGRISFEMDESVIDADSLRPHQLYADIDSPAQNSRTLRFTSSFFDGEIRGSIIPSTLDDMTRYWGDYLQGQINEEIFLGQREMPDLAPPAFSVDDNPIVDLTGQINLKDLDLLRKYIPQFPEITSRARISGSANATKNRLLVSTTIFDENLRAGALTFQNLNSSFSGNFRYGEPLKLSGNADVQISTAGFSYESMKFKDTFFNLSLRDDSVQVRQELVRERDDLKLVSGYTGVLHTDSLEFIIDDFEIGTIRYNWQTAGTSRIIYRAGESLVFDNIAFRSDSGFVGINGVFSSSFEDSVKYTVQNLNLARISDLINGRISFSGIMNGEFTTRTLADIPSIQGEINVEHGMMNGRTVGDVSLMSRLNPEENQFDTEIRIFTDPDKYGNYLGQNNGIGHDLHLDGYFKLPDEAEPGEDLFYFDADLRQIDMWIVTAIVPSIIADMEGLSVGSGYIRGGLDGYDFDTTFEIIDVSGTPVFTNVDYTLNGELDFNRSEGLLLRDIELADSRGGSGLLNGQVDLEDFEPQSSLDLTLDMNNLQFMNNPYNPDVPFYAHAFGTGQVRITGTNFDPFLRTSTPISISPNSSISIPLEDETEFDRDNRFIRFVNTFDLEALEQNLLEGGGNGRQNGNTLQEDLSFAERFTMDLQFEANQAINVNLIFDRVTNEILSAQGTGQIRLLLEDQDVSMFGRFDIEGGEYLFVSGDIFTRNFNLEEGGTINWQGDIDDADLNVTAIYRARPNISTLLASSPSVQAGDTGQRISVELVLQISGSLSTIQNNFFFRVPSGIEGTSDPTITTQINNLNQNQDEKLLQATSILLSGNFIPTGQTEDGLGLGDNFSGTAAFVNPLISSQVINPLLSNQINSLLSSDVSFDVDFNLNAFNEVDLGVALRLFDDRVVLRREGQVTGRQSDIGDLGATYRINRTFSLTAFHRQDPTLANNAAAETRQTQEMNGIGLEARFQFNTWQNLRRNISNGIRTFFGIRREEDDESETEDHVISAN